MWLVAFDFDGTLSPSEMTTLLGQRRGVGDEIDRITEAAMAGEIEYAESLRRRVAALGGLPISEMQAAFEAIELYPGAAELLDALAGTSVTTAVLTGGFARGVEVALAHAGVSADIVVANRLVLADGRLTGDVSGPHVEGDKGETLRRLVDELDVSLDATVAVGDGANDLRMLEFASLSVGFRPTPVVEPACDVTVTSMAELEGVFHVRGFLP